MRDCEQKLETPIEASTFVGPDETTIICEVGGRDDLRHYVNLHNLCDYPIDITPVARIQSDPRVLRFGAVYPSGTVSDDNWTAILTLDKEESGTVYASLATASNDSTRQEIAVRLIINRWHWEHGEYELSFPVLTVSC